MSRSWRLITIITTTCMRWTTQRVHPCLILTMNLNEWLTSPFLWRAMIGGAGVALIVGPLGAFIVWRKMAYFGDTLAHSGLLGVALGFLLGVSPSLGVLMVCLLLAALLVFLELKERLSADTLLGLLAHTTLALGLIALAFLETTRFDLAAFLFGDLLAVTRDDLIWIGGGVAVAFAVLLKIWRPLLAATVDEELARAENVPVTKVKTAFTILVALVIACAMKVVGVLLITALLVIPAATAQRFTKSPETMALAASGVALAAVIGGLLFSLLCDTPASASVVAVATLIFVVSRIIVGFGKK
ncbi:MAG: metal ABC transporter permease [Burkholderiales bacterium]|nr:metal ABC transporter permease [Burkholderiales bacterium]